MSGVEQRLVEVIRELRLLRKELAGGKKEALSIADAASRLSISPEKMRRMIRNGDVTPFNIGRRVLIATKEIDKLVASSKAAPTPPSAPKRRGTRDEGARLMAEIAKRKKR